MSQTASLVLALAKIQEQVLAASLSKRGMLAHNALAHLRVQLLQATPQEYAAVPVAFDDGDLTNLPREPRFLCHVALPGNRRTYRDHTGAVDMSYDTVGNANDLMSVDTAMDLAAALNLGRQARLKS